MSYARSSTHPKPVTLSRAEQWVAHHVLVKALDEAYDRDELPPWWIPQLIEKVESANRAITHMEGWGLRSLLTGFASNRNYPDAERRLAEEIIHRIDVLFGRPPSSPAMEGVPEGDHREAERRDHREHDKGEPKR